MRISLPEDDGIEVQLAPLIDCVFLLLIFFLVATTLRKVDRELPLDLPDAAAAIDVQQPEGVAIIALDRDGNLYLDGTPVTRGALQSTLRTRAQENPKLKVRVDVDRGLPFQQAMEILDLLRFERIPDVGLQVRRETP